MGHARTGNGPVGSGLMRAMLSQFNIASAIGTKHQKEERMAAVLTWMEELQIPLYNIAYRMKTKAPAMDCFNIGALRYGIMIQFDIA
jgi:hypothetical protein